MNENKIINYNRGYQDGKLSATCLANPMHNNWKRDKSNKVQHPNKIYLKGYMDGFKENSQGVIPFCL